MSNVFIVHILHACVCKKEKYSLQSNFAPHTLFFICPLDNYTAAYFDLYDLYSTKPIFYGNNLSMLLI